MAANMKSDDPEPMWRTVVGDTEPWRRGRVFLVALAVWTLLSQSLVLGSEILLGRIEILLLGGAGALIFWLLFYFIWIGVHWVRWLTGGFLMLVSFAHLIWGIRDGNTIRLIDGSIGFPIAAYLGLAPSVYFFALRQKETVRWLESIVVATVLGLVFVSLGTVIFALARHKAEVEVRGLAFADRAFRRVFVEGDEEFLKSRVTAHLMQREKWERLSWFMTDREMRLGEARELRPVQGQLRFRFQFPATLISEGRMFTEAQSDGGPVRFFIIIGEAGGEWQIDGIYWNFIDQFSVPQ